jgi:hypothetical protein
MIIYYIEIYIITYFNMFEFDCNKHRFELDTNISAQFSKQGIVHIASTYCSITELELKIGLKKSDEFHVIIPLYRCNQFHPNMYTCMVCVTDKHKNSILYIGYTVIYELTESQITESINARHDIHTLIIQYNYDKIMYKRHSNCIPFFHIESYDKSEIGKSVIVTMGQNEKEPQFESGENISWWQENFGDCGNVEYVAFSWKP